MLCSEGVPVFLDSAYPVMHILMYCSDNPEVTVGGHAPLRAESSGGQRSTSPYLVEGKRNSSAPLLEPTNKSGKGAEFTGND